MPALKGNIATVLPLILIQLLTFLIFFMPFSPRVLWCTFVSYSSCSCLPFYHSCLGHSFVVHVEPCGYYTLNCFPCCCLSLPSSVPFTPGKTTVLPCLKYFKHRCVQNRMTKSHALSFMNHPKLMDSLCFRMFLGLRKGRECHLENINFCS